MNQEFLLRVTPAIARRLLRMAKQNAKINVTHELLHAAKCNRISADDFDTIVCKHSPEREDITQFLLDCDLRGVVQAMYHPTMNEVAMLNVVRLARQTPVTVISVRRSVWRLAAKVNFLDDVHVVSPGEMTGQEIDARRHGIAVVDLHSLSVGPQSQANRYAREFPRLTFYSSVDDTTHWTSLAACLFPTMPHPLSVKRLPNNPAYYSKTTLCEFAQFYNTCIFPEHITSLDLISMADF